MKLFVEFDKEVGYKGTCILYRRGYEHSGYKDFEGALLDGCEYSFPCPDREDLKKHYYKIIPGEYL